MEFNLFTILVLLLVFAGGAFVGVQLGRRSKTANAYADRIQAELDKAEAYIHELEAKVRKPK